MQLNLIYQIGFDLAAACMQFIGERPSSGIGSRGTNLMPKYHEKGLVLLWSRTRKNCSSLTRGFSWSRMRKIVQVLVLK